MSLTLIYFSYWLDCSLKHISHLYFFVCFHRREVNRHSSLKRHAEHLLLKGYVCLVLIGAEPIYDDTMWQRQRLIIFS